MEHFSRFLEGSNRWFPDYSLESTLLSLLLAFVLGQLVAWVYINTHSGLSYSKAFTQSLVIINMVVCLVMHVIGNNIVTAFGLIGALAIIRFRNVLKDTRDTAFIFLVIVLGMAIGSQRYVAGITGAVSILLVAVYLHVTSFGSRGHFDGYLTCWLSDGNPGGLRGVLHRFCRRIKEVSIRQGGVGGQTEYVFQVRLRDPKRREEMVDSLRSLPETGDVALVIRDEVSEV